jgi:hypothetical protein
MLTDLMHQISVVEERLRLAMLASDFDTLDELISPDLIFTNHCGQVLGKQDDLESHRNGLLRMHKLEPSEMRVNASAVCGGLGAHEGDRQLRWIVIRGGSPVHTGMDPFDKW